MTQEEEKEGEEKVIGCCMCKIDSDNDCCTFLSKKSTGLVINE